MDSRGNSVFLGVFSGLGGAFLRLLLEGADLSDAYVMMGVRFIIIGVVILSPIAALIAHEIAKRRDSTFDKNRLSIIVGASIGFFGFEIAAILFEIFELIGF